eukprot:CAMPEP_0196575666 /NCGR_PEP_ID=MMETSP1081-20130531/5089_1 /TAXON_ID=36882 /ORGANISM="Pyramimonas amylifera, Strain CCMP720" /LENGTH=964 /DNA_ID=CAMNT_0041894035 /DNA_START=70 /DNA_END=2964 /DNA_ORIENTATION=-
MGCSGTLQRHSCRQSPVLICLSALLLISLISVTEGKVLGIDFGSENIKVSLVKPGRVPISIVTNEMSKRRSPGAVAFVNGERLLGEEAMALEPRYPDRVFTKIREMIGRTADSNIIDENMKQNFLPFSVVEHPERKTAQIKTPDGESYSSEEIVAMILHYVRTIGAAYAEADIVDVVITVPAFYSQSQREAMLLAADLAGLNVLSLVTEHAAAALQWGIDKEFGNETKEVVLYDMGAGSVTASLVQYSSFIGKEGGKNKTFGQFEVKSVAWDHSVGAGNLDALLVNHFADQFNTKWGKGDDVRNYPKAMAKLKKQCKRTKEILSANLHAPISVESMHDDIDFRSDISREAFDSLAAPLYLRAVAPLTRLLKDSGREVASLEAVELLGGGTRIPGVLAAITEALGGRTPDRHLDSDEAVALGAGLHAANLSTAFRVRKFGAADAASYALSAQYTSSDTSSEDNADEAAEVDAVEGEDTLGSKKMKLLPLFKKYPVKRVVSLTHKSGDALLEVGYSDAPSDYLPSDSLAAYTISGVDSLSSNYSFQGKVNVHFQVTSSGILQLTKAEAVVELPDLPAPTKKVVNTTEDSNSTAGETEVTPEVSPEAKEAEVDAAQDPEKAATETEKSEETESANSEATKKDDEPPAGSEAEEDKTGKKEKKDKKGKKEEKEEVPKKKRVARIPLKVEVKEAVSSMQEEEFKAAQATMKAWLKKDQVKKEAAEAKNGLESYIIATREKVSYDEGAAAVTTAEQRETLLADLMDAEDWLYMDGENAPVHDFRAKLLSLKNKGDPIFERVFEASERPAAVASAKKFIDVARQVVAAWSSVKPWINETDKEALLTDVDKLDAWLEEQEEAQKGLEAHEVPAFKAASVKLKVTPLETRLAKLKKTPKPKKPATSNTTSTNSTTNESDAKEAKDEPLKITIDDEEVILPPQDYEYINNVEEESNEELHAEAKADDKETKSEL